MVILSQHNYVLYYRETLCLEILDDMMHQELVQKLEIYRHIVLIDLSRMSCIVYGTMVYVVRCMMALLSSVY